MCNLYNTNAWALGRGDQRVDLRIVNESNPVATERGVLMGVQMTVLECNDRNITY